MRYLLAALLLFLALPAYAQQLNPPGGGGSTGGSGSAVFLPGSVSITGNRGNGQDQISGVNVNGWQNVMAWGADPSGAVDSTVAFNNAAGATVSHDSTGAEYWGTLFCPSMYWTGTNWMPAHYKLSGTVLIPGWSNVYCADAIWDYSTAPSNVIGVQLGSNPQDQSVGAWMFHPAHVMIGALWGPGQRTNSIGIVTGNCPAPGATGPNGRGCAPNGLYGQWMKSQLTNSQIAYWGTALAIGGNTYDNQFTRNTFWMNGVGYDERYMWQGTFTNGGTDMVLSENTFTYNDNAAYICASNELNMQDNAFEDNAPPYIIMSFCNGAGPATWKIRSRFEYNNLIGTPPTPTQPEFIDIQGGVGILDLSGSNWVDSGAGTAAVGVPVCYDSAYNNQTNGHIIFDGSYAGFLTNLQTRPLFGLCGTATAANTPSISYFHMRPIGVAIPDPNTFRLTNPTLTLSGRINGATPVFAQAAFSSNNGLYGIISRLTCINQDGAACSTGMQINVVAASTPGNAVNCSNTIQTTGAFNTVNENLAVGPGINFGIINVGGALSCTANFLTSLTLVQTQ